MKKLFLLVFTLFFIANATAAIDSIQGTNIFPDSEVRFRDTEVVVELTSDSTTTTTVELWIQKPDETYFQSDTGKTVDVKSGNPRKVSFSIESDNLNQYGNYDIIANETNNGLNSTIQTELVPRPNIKLSNPTTIRINGFQETYFNLDINTFIGEKIPVEEIQAGNLTIYRITDNESTPNDIEKTLEVEKKFTVDNLSGDLETLVDTSALPEGSYELRAKANISSCDVCEVYDTTTSDVVNIGEDYAYTVYNEKWKSNDAGIIYRGINEVDGNVDDQNDLIGNLTEEVRRDTQAVTNSELSYRFSVILLLVVIIGFLIYFYREG